MQLGQRIILEQRQELVMTQELIQAIELLQYNSLELTEYLQKQVEENPMLEIEKDKSEDADQVNWEEYIKKDRNSHYTPDETSGGENDINYDSFISHTISLEEHLLSQLILLKTTEDEFLISKYMIQNIDDDGYLTMSLEEISEELDLDIELIKDSLEIVQSLQPAGIGARSLEESLMLQLEDKRDCDKLTMEVVENYLEDIGYNRLKKVSSELNVSIEEIQRICDTIRTLDPKPGRSISGNKLDVNYIVPDVTIRKVDGEFVILINDVTGPRLNINPHYKKIMLENKNEETKDYLSERFDSALWIIKSIEQRRQTIRKVVESILKRQIEFFEDSSNPIQPMTLKDIAEDIEMHESTVSRATNDKYIETPHGIFEMKYFFNTGLQGDKGQVSTLDVKDTIKEIIDAEDKKKPLSDQKIVEILEDRGVNISRRTVAKYRDELGILSSTRRKRF